MKENDFTQVSDAELKEILREGNRSKYSKEQWEEAKREWSDRSAAREPLQVPQWILSAFGDSMRSEGRTGSDWPEGKRVKVYGSYLDIFVYLAVAAAVFSLPGGHLRLNYWFGDFFAFFAFYQAMVPTWSYDNKGFDILGLGGGTKKRYDWGAVTAIRMRRSLRSSWFAVEVDGVQVIKIERYGTRYAGEVLSDAVHFARKHNPKVFVDTYFGSYV